MESGKFKDQFKIEDGVKSAEKFLTASIEEMKMALRAMGKRSLKELSKKDLVSYDELTAKMIGIPFSFEPWEDKQKRAVIDRELNGSNLFNDGRLFPSTRLNKFLL